MRMHPRFPPIHRMVRSGVDSHSVCRTPGRPRLRSLELQSSYPAPMQPSRYRAQLRPSSIIHAGNDLQTHTCMVEVDVSVPWAQGVGQGEHRRTTSAASLGWSERRRRRLGLKMHAWPSCSPLTDQRQRDWLFYHQPSLRGSSHHANMRCHSLQACAYRNGEDESQAQRSKQMSTSSGWWAGVVASITC